MEPEESESKKKNEAEKHLLSSGTPCTVHGCVECCKKTSMPLSRLDVERIKSKGYRVKDFTVKHGGELQLKNSKGKCVFLRDNRCIIYSVRPEGCRFYPLVYDENCDDFVIHDFCPHGHEFKFSKEDVEKLSVLLKKLYKTE